MKARPKPNIRIEAAHAPHQITWSIDAAHLNSSDQYRLWSAIKVELYQLHNQSQPFYQFEKKRFSICDPTEQTIKQLTELLHRFNGRPLTAQDAEDDELPRIAWRHRAMAYLFPTGQRRNSYEVLPMLYSKGRHSFDVTLSATVADLPFLRALKALHQAYSVAGVSVKVRAGSITISSESRHTAYDMGKAVAKILGRRQGRDEQAISPAALLPYYLLCTPAE